MKRVYRYRDIEITSVHKAKYMHITVNWYCHFNNEASSESHCAACVRCIMQVTGAAVVHVNQYVFQQSPCIWFKHATRTYTVYKCGGDFDRPEATKETVTG